MKDGLDGCLGPACLHGQVNITRSRLLESGVDLRTIKQYLADTGSASLVILIKKSK